MDLRRNMQVIPGDCLEKMTQLATSSVSLVILDPPYGTTPLFWDKCLDFEMLWKEYGRILVPDGVVCVFGQEPFSSYVRLSNIQNYRYDWYWEKERLTNVFQVKRRPGKTIETISVFFSKPNRYYPQLHRYEGKRVTNKIGNTARWSVTMGGVAPKSKPLEYRDNGTRHPTQLLQYNRDNNRKGLHPTQKPVSLLEYLIKTYTLEGETVLDNCMGSGSTGVACVNTHRDFIGIEKDEDYFLIARNRIKEATNE
jgi:DNA modification methylase